MKFATFSEQQYHSILKSPNLLRLKLILESLTKRLKLIDDVRSDKDACRDKLKAMDALEETTHISIDDTNAQLKMINESMERCLMQA